MAKVNLMVWMRGCVLAGALSILWVWMGTANAAGAAVTGCEDGEQPSGAIYRICMPESWNGDLVVYAHGYVAPTEPVGIPADQFSLEGVGDIDALVTARGYAFAASSYRANGLVVEEGIADSLEVVTLFAAQHGQPGRVLLVGVSEGALITALSMERHADVYDGGLAMCGPVGDFRRQIDYFGDFRTVFDVYFPDVMPPTPVDIPPALLDTWETETYSTTVKPLILDPANAISVTQLLNVTGAPFDPEDAETQEATVERLLWYNVYATNDARLKLGGQPYDNVNRVYGGGLNDAELNARVARIAAEPGGLAGMAAIETTGQIGGPLVAMHTSGDPVIPAWHLDAYTAKIQAAGRGDYHEAYRFARYGHCSFAVLEMLGAFDRLVQLVDTFQPPVSIRSYLPAVTR